MAKSYAGFYEGYKGPNQFMVDHPKFGTAIVAAPDEDTAIVAAAKAFGVSWKRVDFYSYCKVRKI